MWGGGPSSLSDMVYTLQMADPDSGHGFLNVYVGSDNEYTCTGLTRSTAYRFRVSSSCERLNMMSSFEVGERELRFWTAGHWINPIKTWWIELASRSGNEPLARSIPFFFWRFLEHVRENSFYIPTLKERKKKKTNWYSLLFVCMCVWGLVSLFSCSRRRRRKDSC